MKTVAKMLRRGNLLLLAVVVALTVVAGSAALAGTGEGTPFDLGEIDMVNTHQLGDNDSARFTAGGTYRTESSVGPGIDLGDGTFEVSVSCDPGGRLVSGWPANINSTSTLLESSAEDPDTWSVRINKNGWTDDFSAEILCAGQHG